MTPPDRRKQGLAHLFTLFGTPLTALVWAYAGALWGMAVILLLAGTGIFAWKRL